MEMVMLCPKASVYYVPGLGGCNPDDFKAPFRQLMESIFGLTFQPKHQEILKNECKFALSPDEKLIRKIQAIVNNHTFCNQVSLVWFAHSHGAKMVCDAYKKLKRTSTFAKMRTDSAIICIGGASLATEDLAQVTINVEFKNDKIAKGGANLIGARRGQVLKVGPFKNRSCLCCVEDSKHEPELKATRKSFDGISLGLSTALKGASTTASSSSAGDLDEEKAHYIGEYLQCKKWRQRVQQMLPIGQPCQTHSGSSTPIEETFEFIFA